MNVPPGDPAFPGEQPPPLPLSARPGVTLHGPGLAVVVIIGAVVFLNLMSWKIAFVIGLVLVATGGWLARRQHAWLKSAQVVRGVVVALVPSKTGTKTTYRPRTRYTTQAGVQREFTDGIGSNRPGYAVGDNVLVAYSAADASDEKLADFGPSYGFAAFVAAFGIGLAFVAATMVVGRIAMPRMYGPDVVVSGPGR